MRAKGSLVSASTEAHVVSDCKTTPALHRAKPHFSREAKGKTLISAINKAVVALLPAAKASICDARFEAPFGSNSKVTCLKKKEYFTVLKH